MQEPLLKDYSSPGRKGYNIDELDIEDRDIESLIDKKFIRKEGPDLPEVSEVDVVRHYTSLSQMNYGVDSGIYPLGSCTMKYNPKINEKIASLENLVQLHPYQPEEQVQGSLEILYELKEDLCEITGMDEISLQPASGSQGELAGLLIIRKYFEKKGEKRNKIIVPDSAHGTNPASASMAGFDIVEVASNNKGMIDIDKLEKEVDNNVAGLMLTNPNTLGIFEEEIKKIAEIVHNNGGLLYYDGANMNAVMGFIRPGDIGFDVIHLNLHKTFSTPHGGGGPGSGPIGVKEKLRDYLPVPLLQKKMNKYGWINNLPHSIGAVHTFYGNYNVMLKAYSYIKEMGPEGLKKCTENAVLNANYLKQRLKDDFELPFKEDSLHEFVLSGNKQKQLGATTLDIAKRLLDYGMYAPTIYFPLIVRESLMIEPTETENIDTMDEFVETLKNISREISKNPEIVKNAPHNTVVSRLDETKAARNPDLRW